MTPFRPSRPPSECVELRSWTLDQPIELSGLRRALHHELSNGGPYGGEELDDVPEKVVLVASELATNALRHGLRLDEPRRGCPVHMSLVRHGSLVTSAFTDPGSSVPVLRYPGPLDTGGLGLHIVESLSLRWGWSALAPHGKIVWAVLS